MKSCKHMWIWSVIIYTTIDFMTGPRDIHISEGYNCSQTYIWG
ncbi:hypothetical protein OROHE_016921 [Orobanche hederae]